MKIYILLLCLLSLSSMSVKITKKTEISNEEYAVYSAYLNGIEENPNDGKAVRIIVINDHPAVIKSSCSQDNVARYNKRIDNNELKVLFEDLQARSVESESIKRLFNIRHDYVLLNEKDFAAVFGVESSEGWENFYKKYPNSSGYITLSRVGFNLTFTKAIIFIEQGCGTLCGSGNYILFEKIDGKWKNMDVFNCWIS